MDQKSTMKPEGSKPKKAANEPVGKSFAVSAIFFE
jgi:hypothetical protein